MTYIVSQNQRILDKCIDAKTSCDVVVRVSSVYSVVSAVTDDCWWQWIETDKIGDHIVFLKIKNRLEFWEKSDYQENVGVDNFVLRQEIVRKLIKWKFGMQLEFLQVLGNQFVCAFSMSLI